MASQTKEVTKSGNVTTTTTKTSYKVEGDPITTTYRPITMARPVLHIERSGSGIRGAGSSGGYSRMSASHVHSSIPTGAFLKMSSMGSDQVKGQRVKEKKDLQDLNQRLADYIEKVRFLEAQNRKLVAELEALKAKWGKETTAIKQMYETELAQARNLLDDSEKERSTLELRLQSTIDLMTEKSDRLEELERIHAADVETIERQNHQLGDYEAELGLLRRRVAQFEKDATRDKADKKRLQGDVQRGKQDLDQETLSRVVAENEKQSLKEELEFMKQVHEQEMKELAALAYRDTTAENREYWKNELSQAIHDIQQEYEGKLDQMRGDLDAYYEAKMSEFGAGQTRSNMETAHAKEEVKKLRTQNADMRARIADLEAKLANLERMEAELRRECEEKERQWDMERSELEASLANARAELESVLAEVQALLDTKLSLELEIAAYRKLLEGEETRTGLKNAVDGLIDAKYSGNLSSGYSSMSSSSMSGGSMTGASSAGGMKGEMSAKTTYQRSAKGNVSIAECSGDGKYIILENTGKKEEMISNWKITRRVDNKNTFTFTFPNPCKLSSSPKNKLKIWGRAVPKSEVGVDDMVGTDNSWGIGANIVTSLVNADGEERASHVQRTQYS